MTDQFNGLTPAEHERLSMLAEEASEIVKACMKIMRHGYESYNPDTPEAGGNRAQLEGEVADLGAVWGAMVRAGDVADVYDSQERWDKKLRYSHHQPSPPPPRTEEGMSMTMLERVALALAVAQGGDPDAQFSGGQVVWRYYVRAARPAIQAMRDPDENMLETGNDMLQFHGYDARLCWPAMIDAALSPTNEPLAMIIG